MEHEFDLFISHASEDKVSFVRPLADLLIKFGVRVWYDEFSLHVGDSLTKAIDKGLLRSRFGLVILSPAFLEKDWTDYELRSLLSKELGNESVILPLWYNIDRKEILNFSPFLADKFAIVADSENLTRTAASIVARVRPDLSEKIQRRAKYLLAVRNSKTANVPLKDLKFSPPKHDKLPLNLLSRVRLIRSSLFEVDPKSLDFWVDGFRADLHPSKEIRIWEHIATCYNECKMLTQFSEAKPEGIYAALIMLSCGSHDFEIDGLTNHQISILREMWQSPLPIYDIKCEPFPESYKIDAEAEGDMIAQDLENFPFDIPDELILDLLHREDEVANN